MSLKIEERKKKKIITRYKKIEFLIPNTKSLESLEIRLEHKKEVNKVKDGLNFTFIYTSYKEDLLEAS